MDTADAGGRPTSIKARLTSESLALTPAEAKIAQVLLTDYPVSGLGSQASLAKRAQVSDPTVVRFAAKLGFSGFAAFQASLLEEVEARLRSPLMMVESKLKKDGDRSVVQSYLDSVATLAASAAETAVTATYERAVDMVMEAKQVGVLGGRFSRHVAGMLAGYLAQFRGAIVRLDILSAESFDSLIDLSKKDVLVVFDYRRYQINVVDFAAQAAERGVKIILFTDAWLSPVSAFADLTITGPVEVDSPYDSLVGAVAQMEALVAQLVYRESGAMSRMEELERVRSRNGVSVTGRD